MQRRGFLVAMLAAGAAPAVYARDIFRPAHQPIWHRGGVLRNELLDYGVFSERVIRQIAAGLEVPFRDLQIELDSIGYKSLRLTLHSGVLYRPPSNVGKSEVLSLPFINPAIKL